MKGPGVTQAEPAGQASAENSRTSTATSSGSRGNSGSSSGSHSDLERAARNFGGSPLQLAEFEEVDVRSVFPRDGDGFTDWLSANLDKLAREVGISGLREVGRDLPVGSFTVNLLAQTDRGRRVVIEPQLEPSDHPHLGQVITYAAGLDVSAVIWIVTRIGEEHRAVLDWLNRHSDDDVRFFGVELRLVRIGNSPPAAEFRVEVRPNDWQKVARQRQRVGAPLNARMREF
jgi:hypothetical protein